MSRETGLERMRRVCKGIKPLASSTSQVASYPKQPSDEQHLAAQLKLAELVGIRIKRDADGRPYCIACGKPFGSRQAVWAHYGKMHK